ncbi:hypothetical protein ECZC18_54610 [Escherichia coli]|nr:hypothetical protein ECZC18_54610 [Escherichia coli]
MVNKPVVFWFEQYQGRVSMKRLLPLLLGLAVSVAQADSNSDYRAGSDFARQIQGQGRQYSGL